MKPFPIVVGFDEDRIYNLDDYTRFETFEITLREYVPEVMVRRQNKKALLKVLNKPLGTVFNGQDIVHHFLHMAAILPHLQGSPAGVIIHTEICRDCCRYFFAGQAPDEVLQKKWAIRFLMASASKLMDLQYPAQYCRGWGVTFAAHACSDVHWSLAR